MPYTLTTKPKDKSPYWIIPPNGSENIASGCKHTDRAKAERHMALLNAFFGGGRHKPIKEALDALQG